MAALLKFISISEAAKKIHASVEDLRPLIEKRKIKAVTINGEIFVDTLTLPKKILKKQDVPDNEYERNGSANIFMVVEPLIGKRKTFVTDQRTNQDFAKLLRCLSDDEYPEIERIGWVTDNLNIHSPACLYERFEPAEARRLAQRFEWHYTPEHGSWLNMAEIELGILHRQCTNRRISNKKTLTSEVAAGEKDRNNVKVQINRQFKPHHARIKLQRLYPVTVTKNSS